VNGQPSSSFGGAQINNLWNGYNQNVMGAQQNMLQNVQNRQQRSLSEVLGGAQTAGNAATQDYSEQYNIGKAQADQFMSGLGSLGSSIGKIYAGV
jgi:hypothetical protein